MKYIGNIFGKGNDKISKYITIFLIKKSAIDSKLKLMIGIRSKQHSNWGRKVCYLLSRMCTVQNNHQDTICRNILSNYNNFYHECVLFEFIPMQRFLLYSVSVKAHMTLIFFNRNTPIVVIGVRTEQQMHKKKGKDFFLKCSMERRDLAS